MAVTQATTLADFTSGIGTAGAVFQVDNENQRIGIGTTNPQSLLQVGDDIKMGGGIITATTFDGALSSFTGKFTSTGIGVSVSNGTASTATIAAPANLIIDPGVVGDDTGLVRIKGNLFVDGTTTQINSTTLEIADFVVGVASTATTDLLTDGAGIKIGPDNTFLYEHNGGNNSSLKSSENLNVASGKVYQIGETERLSADTLSVGTGATIHSPTSNVLTLGTNNAERLRIDSGGRILQGTNSYKSNLNSSADASGQLFQFVGKADNTNHCISVFAYSGTSNSAKRGAKLQLHRARSTDGTTNTAVANNDLIGTVEFKGNDATSFTAAAKIDCFVDGTPGTDDMPGRLVFSTSSDGSGVPTERLRIHSDGMAEIFGSGPGGVLQLSSTDTTISAAGEVFGSITFKANDTSTGQTGVFAKIDAASNRLFDGDNASGMDLRFYAGNKGDGVNTPPERLRIDSTGAITVGNRSDIHSTRALARFGIDCQGKNVIGNENTVANYGLAFYNDPTSNYANGIGFFNDDGQTCGGYIIHQDKGSANLGDIIFGTAAAASTPLERLRITSAGDVSISGDGTVHGVSKLTLLPANRTTAFSAGDGDTWHDVVLKQTGDATNNAVGIAFEVSADAYHKNAGTGIAAVKNGTDSDYGSDLVFITRPQSAVAVERLRIKSDGKIGINNTDPLYAMHFKNAMASTPSFIHMEVTGSNAVGGGGGIAFDTSASNAQSNNSLYLATITGIRNSSDDGSNDLVFKTTRAGAPGDDGNDNTPKERLRITSAGKMGLGYDSPDTMGTGRLVIGNGSGSETLTIFSSSTTNGNIHFADGTNSQDRYRGYITYQHSDGVNDNYMAFGTDDVERLRITSVGQIQHRASGGDNQFISKRTDAAGSNGNYFFHFRAQNNTPVDVGSFGFHRDTSTDDSRFVVHTRKTGGSNDERLRITSSGDMRLGGSGTPATKLDVIDDQNTIPFSLTANTGTFVGVMVRTRHYLEFSVEFPYHATQTSIQLKFSRTQNAPSISIDYFSGGGYQVDHGVTGVAYISFYSASGNTLYTGTSHQSAYGAATPSWSHSGGTSDVLFKLSNIAYSSASMCHFRINMPRGGIDNVTVDRTTP